MFPLAALLAAAAVGSPQAASPPEPPAFDALLAEARRTGKPIFLDVYADWCGPCKALELNVFPRRQVKAALSRYLFVRYDAEKGPGVEVAEKFGVEGYPTLIALTPDGLDVERAWSHDPDALATHLDEVYPLAKTRGPYTEAEAKRRGNDAGLWFITAMAARRHNAAARSRELLARAEAADPGDKAGIASIAALTLARDEAAREGPKGRARLYLSYASKYPSSAFTRRCLEGLAAIDQKDRPPRAELHAAAEKIGTAFDAVKDPTAVQRAGEALMALGEQAAAAHLWEALLRLQPYELRWFDRLAEARFREGQREEAISLLEKAQKVEPNPRRLLTLQSYRAGKPGELSFERFTDVFE